MKYFLFIICLLLVAAGVFFGTAKYYSSVQDNNYEQEAERYKRQLDILNRNIDSLNASYYYEDSLFQRERDSLKDLIARKDFQIIQLSEYYASISDKESIKELEDNLDTTLLVNEEEDIVFLPTIKTRPINQTYAERRLLKEKTDEQSSLISVLEQNRKRDSLQILGLNDMVDNIADLADSCLVLNNQVNSDLMGCKEELSGQNRKLRASLWANAIQLVLNIALIAL